MLNLNNKIINCICLIASCFVISHCSDGEDTLSGVRFGLDVPLETSELINSGEMSEITESNISDQILPILLPEQKNYLEWTHRNGNAEHKIIHPYISESPELVWKVKIGKGLSLIHI